MSSRSILHVLACGFLACALSGGFAAAKPKPAGGKPAASPPPVVEGETIEVPTSAGVAADPKHKEACFPVDKVIVKGINLVPSEDVRAAVAARASRCIGNGAARDIVAAVNASHSAKGYVTTQGYVPQQDLKTSRTFVVNVVTGRVGKVVYRETNADVTFGQAWKDLREATGPWDGIKRLSVLVDAADNALDRFQLLPPKHVGGLKAWLATPVDPNDPVQIDQIQQGIDQLNRAPSQRANAKLEPGTAPATSDVVIDVKRQDSFRMFAGYEINGANLNGNGTTPANRARLDMFKDNLVGINDSWAASYAGGLDTNELRGSLSIPFRWLTLSMDGGYSEYLTPLSHQADLFSQLYTGAFNASYLVSRDKEQQTSIQAGLNWRHFERFINGQPLTPQTISYVRVGATHQRFWENKQLVVSAGINQGLEIMGATRDPGRPEFDVPRAQFFKIDGAASYLQAFPGIGLLRVDLAGQWSEHPLYAEDQIVLGSVVTVRGFTRSPYRVDRGAYVRTEFASALPMDLLLGKYKSDLVMVDEVGRGLQLYGFTNFGGGHDVANRRDVVRGSVGGGVRYKHGRVSADFTVAKPVYQDGIPNNRDTYKPEYYLVVSTQIF